MGTYCVKQTKKMKPTKQVRKIKFCQGFSILYKLIELLMFYKIKTSDQHLIKTRKASNINGSAAGDRPSSMRSNVSSYTMLNK